MRYIHDIKIWKSVTNPKKSLFLWQFVTAIIPAVLELILTILSASLIGSLSVFDYDNAIKYLILSIVALILCFVFWNINYILYPKQLGHIYNNIHSSIFQKILHTDNESLKQNSKEKMVNILSTNLISMAEFTNQLSQKITYLITSITMLCFIFYYNFIVGLFCFAIATFSFLIYSIINLYRARQTHKLQNARDELLENFGDVVDGRNLSTDLNLISKLQNKYSDSVKNIIKNYKKEHIIKLFAEKYVFFFWKIMIFAVTFYLFSLLKNYTLSLTVYLIITPYLASTILNFFSFLSVFSDLNIAKISALRIKTIMDMSEKDIIDFGNNCTNEINGSASFTNISFDPHQSQNTNLFGKLEKTSFQIKSNSFVLFQGVKGCGKRSIFYMLKREIRPTTGTITFDTINIYDFDTETYSKNISYVTRSPFFFNDSIINNLRYVNKNIKDIRNIFKYLKIDEQLFNLPNKLETNLLKDKDLVSPYIRFMIGIARCLLTSSEIIMIYELPIGLSKQELKNIENVLLKIKKNHTLILFSASNYFPSLIDFHFLVENGKVKTP
ncbi:MAG: ABC transporter ATP-binding protein [Clostridia bacterium]|nr:ABC transporter ATP-binding protein [Clostridia bacterium]